MANTALRNVRITLWVLVAIAGLSSTWLFLRPEPPAPQQVVADSLGQGDYELVTHDGQAFDQSSLVGQPSLVFFGFTHCPDVCPTTMGDIAMWVEELGPLAEPLRVFMLTVDPERDTPEILADYVGWIPGAQGVTGSTPEMRKALAAFRIYASRVELDEGGYTMDHSAYVMLFDSQGRYDQIFSYQQDDEQVIARLRTLLEAET